MRLETAGYLLHIERQHLNTKSYDTHIKNLNYTLFIKYRSIRIDINTFVNLKALL